MSSTNRRPSRPPVTRHIRIVPIRRDTPDVRRLARALLNLAYANYKPSPMGDEGAEDLHTERSDEGEGTRAKP